MDNVTLNQIAYSIFEQARGKISDDENIAIKKIKDAVHDARASLLKQKFDKNVRVIDDMYTQSLGALEIESVDSSAYSAIRSGRYMYRTVKEIPVTIERRNYEGTFTRIGPADKLAKAYNLVSYDRALFSGNGKFNKDQIFCFLRDDRIYLISNSGAYHKTTQFIDVEGVFQNPSQVAVFKDVAGESLYSDDAAYPISRGMRNVLEQMVLKEKFGVEINAPSDSVNDGTHKLNE
jgi:hypothetical protein